MNARSASDYNYSSLTRMTFAIEGFIMGSTSPQQFTGKDVYPSVAKGEVWSGYAL